MHLQVANRITQLFVFEEPTRKRDREDDEGDDDGIKKDLHSTGVIPISFATSSSTRLISTKICPSREVWMRRNTVGTISLERTGKLRKNIKPL